MIVQDVQSTLPLLQRDARAEVAAPVRETMARHMPGLDGVRGFAIILVMLHHFIPEDRVATGWWSIFEVIRSASWCGVDLFFVLSGFLITGILCDTRQEQRYFARFFWRRALRIFPLQYAILIVVLLVLGSVKPINFMAVDAGQLWLWFYSANIPIARSGEWRFGKLSHFWSLAVEEQFYLIWPFVVYYLNPRSLFYACIGCVVGALAIRVAMTAAGFNWISVYVFTPCRMDGLAYGALIALMMRQPGGWEAYAGVFKRIGIAAAGGVVLLAILTNGMSNSHVAVYTFGFTLLVLAFGALVLQVTRENTFLFSVFNRGWLRFMGTYSYGLYVFNQPVDGFLNHSRMFRDLQIEGYGAALIWNVVLGFALTLCLAVPCFHLFERKFLKLKRYV